MVRRWFASFPDAFPSLDCRVVERLPSGGDSPAAAALNFWSEDPSIHTNGHLLPVTKFRILAFVVRGCMACVRSGCYMYVPRRLSAFAIAAQRRRPEGGAGEPAMRA